jgi:4-hydroxy-3-methylbut-2-enyl diphosphate reductase IspH
MKIVEAELKGMSKGKEEAIRYVKKEKQIYQTQNILNQVIISNNKFENTELAEKLNKLEESKERIVREER